MLWCGVDCLGLLGIIKHQAGIGERTYICPFTEEAKKILGKRTPRWEMYYAFILTNGLL